MIRVVLNTSYSRDENDLWKLWREPITGHLYEIRLRLISEQPCEAESSVSRNDYLEVSCLTLVHVWANV